MKTVAVLFAIASTSAFAKPSPDAAIDRLWSLPEPTAESLEMPRAKSTLGDWIKFHQSEPFKFRVYNNVAPVDGYNFVVDYISCSNSMLNPLGKDLGYDARTVGFKPPVYFKQIAVWQQEMKGCVNAFACSYQVSIEGLDDPDAKRVFGPIGTVGSKTPPDYDCFLDAADQVSAD